MSVCFFYHITLCGSLNVTRNRNRPKMAKNLQLLSTVFKKMVTSQILVVIRKSTHTCECLTPLMPAKPRLLPVYPHLLTLLPDASFLVSTTKNQVVFSSYILQTLLAIPLFFVPQPRSLGEQGPDGSGAPSVSLHQPLCLSASSLHFKEPLTALLISTFSSFFPDTDKTKTFIR